MSGRGTNTASTDVLLTVTADDTFPFNLLPAPTPRTSAGYLYVVEYDSGWMKFGCTGCPRARIRVHAAGSPFVQHRIVRCWVSALRDLHRQAEGALLAFAGATCSERHRTEYFRGCDLDAVVRFVRLLPPPSKDAIRATYPTVRIEAIQRLRAERGWDIPTLAGHSGVSASAIKRLENGNSGASDITAYKLARGFGVGVAALSYVGEGSA